MTHARIAPAPVEPAEATRPARIGPYEILSVLGRGAMGIVHRAVDRESGEVVALKTCAGIEEESLAGLQREIGALGRIRHPGVVRIVAQGTHEGLPWFAMELLPEATARTRFEDIRRACGGPTGLTGAGIEQAVALIGRICEPLAYIHAQGIVHGDLKPENVHLRPDGRPVLVDFGLFVRSASASGREPLEVGGKTFGTDCYMAPEQIRGELIDQRADLYALGCMIHEALTGAPPFVGERASDVLYQHLNVEPRPPSARAREVPAWLDALVLQLLRKARRERLGYADVVARRIEAELGIALAPSDAAARSYLYRPELVGRGEALGAMTTHVEAALGGRGALVFVTGESGIGKTRLAMQVGTIATERGMSVILGECLSVASEETGAGLGRVALQPFRAFLSWLADRCRRGGPETTARLLDARAPVLALYEPRLGSLLPAGAAPLPQVSPEAALERVRRAVIDTLAAVAADGPVVLLLDDVQWADELSLQVLAALERRGLADVPLLVVATCRSEEVDGELRDIVERPGTPVVSLERLGPESVGRMVGDMLALPDPPADFVGALFGYAEGNPFYVSEYVFAAVEQTYLHRDEGGSWRLVRAPDAGGAEGYALPIPRSLRTLLQLRLDCLGHVARALVRMGSVLGQSFEEALLVATAVLPEAVGLEAVDELLRRRILGRDGRGVLAFTHAKIRAVAYDGIPADVRPSLHEQAARSIEEYCGDAERRTRYCAALALHWSQAAAAPSASTRVVARAIDALERAGEEAARSEAHHEAIRFFREALRLLARHEEPRADVRRRGARLEQHLGEAYFRVGRMPDARSHLVTALTLAGRRPPSSALGFTARLLREGCRHALHQLLGRAPAERAEDPNVVLRRDAARAYDLLGFVQLLTMERLPSLVSSLQALTIAERIPPSPALSNSGAVLGTIAGALVGSSLAQRYFHRALGAARELGDDYCLARVAHLHGFFLIAQGEWSQAEAALAEAVAAFERIGDGRWRDIALLTMANTHLMHRRAGAMPFYLQALETSVERGDVQARAWAHLGCAAVHVARGAHAQALALLDGDGEALAARFRQLDDPTSEVDAYGIRAMALFRLGRFAEAVGSVRDAHRILDRVPLFRYDPLPGYVFTTDVSLRLWERARVVAPGAEAELSALAARGHRHLRSFARFVRIAQPQAWILSGLRHWLRGRRAAAWTAWQRGLALAERLDMPFEQALTHYEIGRHLEPSEPRERHLGRAAVLFEELGAVHDAAEARVALGSGVGDAASA
jgi:tetratricopeptide (TPR) repeat protein